MKLWWLMMAAPCHSIGIYTLRVFHLCVYFDGQKGSQSEAPDWTSRQPTSDL
jgi:hypothetical protein